MTDLIRGEEPSGRRRQVSSEPGRAHDPAQIVVTIDDHLVVVGINAKDRPGLLLDTSKGLLRLNLELRHAEAAVVNERSTSIWHCEVIGADLPNLEEIWTVLNALLAAEGGVEAIKKRCLRVIRAKVVTGSRLVGKTAAEVGFRQEFKAVIVAVQNLKQEESTSLAAVRFNARDMLVLQASDESPLLIKPPDDFYKTMGDSKDQGTVSRSSSVRSLVNMVSRLGRSASDLVDTS